MRADSGCILYTGQSNGHYGQIEYRRKTYLAHRAAYMVHKGPIPAGLLVCHSCDVKLCVNPEHLWLGTCTDNVQDMIDKGRANYRAVKKLSDDQIRQMVAMRAAGETQGAIAKHFDVAQSLVSMVLSGKRRGDITQAPPESSPATRNDQPVQ